MNDPYSFREGIYYAPFAVEHREDEYDSRDFDLLAKMQHNHFWYRGRHRFLLHAVHRSISLCPGAQGGLNAIDLGGGCGGWISYLMRYKRFSTTEIALGDSSLRALNLASGQLPASVKFFQIDLRNLAWCERWDLAFLLDVLEHIAEDELVLKQIFTALRPGGLLFVTTPALQQLWTWNDEVAGHQKRYCKADFKQLAARTGFRLVMARYFMFLLSPLLLASRLLKRPTPNQPARELLEKMSRVPNALVNTVLTAIFGLETPLGSYLPFPWGTSILAVLQKP